jgi:hypothetical protein
MFAKFRTQYIKILSDNYFFRYMNFNNNANKLDKLLQHSYIYY